MSRRDDLIALRDAVRDGEWFPGMAQRSLGGVQTYHYSREAFYGSVDAALAFLAAVLPGWTVRLTANVGESKSFPYVHIFRMRMTEDDPPLGANSSGYDGFCPARALLLATLNALVAEADT
jgi:hypothetical protein